MGGKYLLKKRIIELFPEGYEDMIYIEPFVGGSSKVHYNNYNFDYKELKDVLDNFKGKFLLSINDSQNIRKLFKKYNISTIKTKYFNPFLDGHSNTTNELIIRNY